jgi:hypothetical protein
MNADRQLPWPRVRLRDVGLDQRRWLRGIGHAQDFHAVTSRPSRPPAVLPPIEPFDLPEVKLGAISRTTESSS